MHFIKFQNTKEVIGDERKEQNEMEISEEGRITQVMHRVMRTLCCQWLTIIKNNEWYLLENETEEGGL